MMKMTMRTWMMRMKRWMAKSRLRRRNLKLIFLQMIPGYIPGEFGMNLKPIGRKILYPLFTLAPWSSYNRAWYIRFSPVPSRDRIVPRSRPPECNHSSSILKRPALKSLSPRHSDPPIFIRIYWKPTIHHGDLSCASTILLHK